MSNGLRRLLSLGAGGILVILVGAVGTSVYAQLNPEIADCEELRDSATQIQTASCNAHIGCSMVLKLQKTCADAKGFLGKLKATLAGRQEITSNDVFEANSPTLMPSPALRSQIAIVQKIVRDAANDPNKGKVEYKSGAGLQIYYEGGLKDGKRHGVGVTIASNGQMDRSQYENNLGRGYGEMVSAIGTVVVSGNWRAGKLSGSGVSQTSDGVVGVGTWDTSGLVGMWEYTYPSGNTNKVLYGADGTRLATGPQAPPGKIAQEPDHPQVVGGSYKP